MAEIGEITEADLSKYNGSTSDLPLLVAIKGKIFDVSKSKDFYGPGGSYAAFAGKDASRALAKMSTKPEDVSSSLDGLTEKEIGVLDNWEAKFVDLRVRTLLKLMGRRLTASAEVEGADHCSFSPFLEDFAFQL